MPRGKSETFGADESGRALDRLVAFSDGVFAIAMTLLVLSLRTPNLSGSVDEIDSELWKTLREQWPELFSYALSFFVIGRYWLVHHRMFRLVRRADAPLLVWNLALLALIALMPYPTEILGRYGDTTTAVVLYSVMMVGVGSVSYGMTRHIHRAGLIDDKVTDEYKAHSLARSIVIPVGFALGIPVAFLDPTAGELTWWVAILTMSLVMNHRYGGAVRTPYGVEGEG